MNNLHVSDQETDRKSRGKRVLVSTIATRMGGVPAMLDFVVNCLEKSGYEPVLAFYEPYGVAPSLSVPSFMLGRRKVGAQVRQSTDGRETHAIGAWLPELEFTHYLATRQWRSVIDSCDYHVSVSGNVLAATHYLQMKRPFLSWVATGWAEDRKDRVEQTFSLPRKLLDRVLNGQILKRQEIRILQRGTILALSRYTLGALNKIAGAGSTHAVMPMPIDVDLFHPDDACVSPGRIGFSGRMDDPRKNVELLLNAAARLVARQVPVTVELLGGELDACRSALIAKLGLEGRVNVLPYAPKNVLAERLRALDVFVVPSHQEGLCIAALEAMSSGCPVVSTRCGGPEDFVQNDRTGELVGFDVDEMANAIERIVVDRAQRARLGAGARKLIQASYCYDTIAPVFWDAFSHAFDEPAPAARHAPSQSA